MDEVKNYLKNLEKLNEQQSRAQEMKNGFKDILQGIKDECNGKYGALSNECKKFIEKTKPILKNLIVLNPRIRLNGGRVCLDGKLFAYAPFDGENCFEVAARARKEVIRNLQYLVNDNPPDYVIGNFASAFNTVMEIMQRADSLAESAYYKLAMQKQDELALLEKQAALLEKEYGGDLPDSIREENERQIRDVFMGGDNFVLRRESSDDAGEAYSKEVRVPIGYNGIELKTADGGCRLITDKAVWDLTKNSVLHVTVKDRAEEFISETIENVVYQFIRNYPLSSVKLVICNPYNEPRVDSFAGSIKKEVPSLFYNVEGAGTDSDRNAVRASVDGLRKLLNTRISQLPKNTDVLTFNGEDPDSAYQIVLLVLNDYSEYYYEDAGDWLSSLFKHGRLGGIYTLAIHTETPRRVKSNLYRDSEFPDLLKEPEAMQATLDCDGVNPVISCGQCTFNANLRGDDFSEWQIIGQIKKAAEEGSVSIPLKGILKKSEGKADYNRDDFSKKISIPIGRSAKSIVTIDFNTKDTTAHAAIAGASGSGKSSLLQDIILGGAYRYSPEELQFIILDFKDGVGLSHFSTLKHVKMMSLKNRNMDAAEIMGYVDEEMKERSREIKRAGKQDIAEYNAKVKQSGGKLMPRLIVIIDEFARMPRQCGSDLKNIATQGRSYGISLVVCSQVVDRNGVYGDAIAQMDHRFEFKNPAVGNLIGSVGDADKSYLTGGRQGSCLYKCGNTLWQMRSAFAGNTEQQEELIDEINAKWSDYEGKPPIITGAPERIFLHSKDVKHDKKAEYDKYLSSKKTVYVPLGKKRLGGEYLYKVDKDNHLLVILGDEKRAASVEYSIAASMACLAQDGPSAYYIDMNDESFADREVNIMMPRFRSGEDGIRYIRSKQSEDFYNSIEGIYKRYKKRSEAYDRDEDVGAPIEIIIHNAENLTSALNKTATPAARAAADPGRLTRPSRMSVAETYAAEQPKTPDARIGADTMFKEIAANGKKCKIYFVLHFTDRNGYGGVMGMFKGEKVKDALIIPGVPEGTDGSALSNEIIVDYLSTVTSSRSHEENSGLFEKTTEMTENDFYYAILMDDSVIYKIIPYEWED